MNLYKAAELLHARETGRLTGDPIQVEWDLQKYPPGSEGGSLGQYVQNSGPPHGITVRVSGAGGVEVYEEIHQIDHDEIHHHETHVRRWRR